MSRLRVLLFSIYGEPGQTMESSYLQLRYFISGCVGYLLTNIHYFQALYEVSLLAHASTSNNFAYLTLVLVGVKGFELLLDLQPLIELEPSFKRAFAKLKQLMRISSQVCLFHNLNIFTFRILIIYFIFSECYLLVSQQILGFYPR